jgi:hypothetical protein
VTDHGPVLVYGEGHRHRRVPLTEDAGAREVDLLLVLQHVPVELSVPVIAEGGREGGAETESARGDRLVRDASGAGAHAVGPDLGARGREVFETREDDVEEHLPGEQEIELGSVGTAGCRQRIEAVLLGHVRQNTCKTRNTGRPVTAPLPESP